MWQPNEEAASKALYTLSYYPPASYGDNVQAVLKASGALSEIERLEALLAMKDETIKTLRERVLKDTATTQDDYDSGYRAA